MKRIALLFVLALIMMLAVACGGSAPAATQAPAQPAATQAPAQPAATSAVPAANGTQVDITLADNTIKSSLTAFKVGVPYTFVITNTEIGRAHV